MAEWEEKLNAILGNPDAMRQIMALSQSLGGEETTPPSPLRQPENPMPDLAAMLGGLDPALVQMGLGFLEKEREGGEKEKALLRALCPYVKEERRKTLEQALQLVRMTHLLRIALDAAHRSGGGQDV